MHNRQLLDWLLPSFPGYPGGWGPMFPGFGPPPRPPWQPDPWTGGAPTEGPPPGPPPAVPPPSATGVGAPGTFAVDPGAFRRCLNRYTYVTLNDGRRFWFWPVFIGRTSVAGYRWRPRQFRWVYMGIDTNQIRFFQCS
ncbi:hypothetical protein [Salipaludibacillus agaradhaerens]|nr:hypothetical protein [Salipaludibacillus agaradhaerens]